jgi:hypothetical protein
MYHALIQRALGIYQGGKSMRLYHATCPACYLGISITISFLLGSNIGLAGEAEPESAMKKQGPDTRSYIQKRSGDANYTDIPREIAMQSFLNMVETIDSIQPADARSWLQRLGIKPERINAIIALAKERHSDRQANVDRGPPGLCLAKTGSELGREQILDAVDDMQDADRSRAQGRYRHVVESLEYDELLKIEHWIDTNVRNTMTVERVNLRDFFEAEQVPNRQIIEKLCKSGEVAKPRVTSGATETGQGGQLVWVIKNGSDPEEQ